MEFNLSFKSGKKKAQGFEPTPHDAPNTISTISTGSDTMSISTILSNALSVYGNPQAAIIWAHSHIAEFGSPVEWVKDACVSIPIVHERLVGKKWVTVEDSKIIKLLSNPNQHQTGVNYKEDYFLNQILTGENFINKFMPIGFGIDKLFIFQSNLVDIDWTNEAYSDFRLKNIECFWVDGFTKILPENMVYRKEVNILQKPTERGVSVLMKLANTARDLQAGTEASITTKETKGSGILTPKENSAFPSGDQKAATKAFRERYGMTAGKNPVIMLGKPLDYTPISMNVSEMGLTESQLINLRNVCSALKFSAQLVGDSKASTYNNMKVIEKSLYTHAVMPRVKSFCETHQDLFEVNREQERLRGDYSNIEALQADRKVNTDIALNYYDHNLITGDQALEAGGYEGAGIKYKKDNEPKIESNGQEEN